MRKGKGKNERTGPVRWQPVFQSGFFPSLHIAYDLGGLDARALQGRPEGSQEGESHGTGQGHAEVARQEQAHALESLQGRGEEMVDKPGEAQIGA